ncbi:MAG: hypothetical protein ABI743_08085, partial [bacterium]
MGPTEYPLSADFGFAPGSSVHLFVALEASYGQSSKGPLQRPVNDPGGRLNPRYFVPEFNVKEGWKGVVAVTGTPTIGAASTSAQFDLTLYDHQGALPGVGVFDPLTAPQNSLRYPSSLSAVTLSLPGALATPQVIALSNFTGDGSPA